MSLHAYTLALVSFCLIHLSHGQVIPIEESKVPEPAYGRGIFVGASFPLGTIGHEMGYRGMRDALKREGLWGETLRTFETFDYSGGYWHKRFIIMGEFGFSFPGRALTRTINRDKFLINDTRVFALVRAGFTIKRTSLGVIDLNVGLGFQEYGLALERQFAGGTVNLDDLISSTSSSGSLKLSHQGLVVDFAVASRGVPTRKVSLTQWIAIGYRVGIDQRGWVASGLPISNNFKDRSGSIYVKLVHLVGSNK